MYPDPELAKKMLHAHQLTDIEEMLIAWVHVVAKVCQLYKSAIGYQGNTLSVEKNAISVVNELPLLPEDFPVLVARKNDPSSPGDCKDLKINKENVLTWLVWLK